MKMILFNQNPMITKLLESVSKKLELSVENFNHYQELSARLKEEPEWILIADDECLEKLDQVDWLELKEIISQNKNSVCMYKKGNEVQPFLEGFEMKIQKPFLPTEILKILQKKLGSNASELEPSQNLDPTQEVLETNWDELENLGDLEALVQEEPNNEEQLLPTLNDQEEKEEVKEEEKEEVKETPQEEKPKDDEIQEGETLKDEEISKELETQEGIKEETQEQAKEQEPIKEETQETKEEKQEKTQEEVKEETQEQAKEQEPIKEETQENKEEKQEKTQEEVKEETQEQAKEQEPIKEETQENKEEKQEKTQDSPSAQELEAMQELVKEIQKNSNSQEDKKETQENTETPQEKEKQELEKQEKTQESAETPQEKETQKLETPQDVETPQEIPQELEKQELETPQEEIQENTEKTQKLEIQEDHYESIEDIPEPVMAQAMGEELPFLNESIAKTSNNENDTEIPKESVIKTPQEKEESIETPKESDKTSSPLELCLNLQDLLKSLNQESLKSLLENKTLNIKITLEDKKPDA
ncbi:chemotaxis regulatory protein ChePep [Helicobacter pylori]